MLGPRPEPHRGRVCGSDKALQRWACCVCVQLLYGSLNQQNLSSQSKEAEEVWTQKESAAAPGVPGGEERVSLWLTAPLAFMSLFPPAEVPLELQLVGEEHLSPAQILGQGAHIGGDVVTGRLDYLLPQTVRPAQLCKSA